MSPAGFWRLFGGGCPHTGRYCLDRSDMLKSNVFCNRLDGPIFVYSLLLEVKLGEVTLFFLSRFEFKQSQPRHSVFQVVVNELVFFCLQVTGRFGCLFSVHNQH